GVRREFDTLLRSQAERILRDLDVVKREEFEAVKDMARLAREENEALKARIAALEAKAGKPRKKAKGSSEETPRLRSARFLALLECCRYNPPRSRPPAPLEACRVRRRRKSRLFP